MKCMVLREMPLGEADKLLTVLSEEEGRISVVAKGAKKPSSRFLAAASVFAVSDMELVKGKSMYILRNANLIKSFYGLREDLDKLETASRMVRAVLKVIQEGLPDPETLVTQVMTPSGMATSMCFKLFSAAPLMVSQPAGSRRFSGTGIFMRPDR